MARQEKSTTVKQVFSLKAPAAMSVMLVGDFTDWQSKPIRLMKGVDGVWSASVSLPPGTYHYRFLVDGEWRDDPECTLRLPNPFGTENGIRVVAPAAKRAQKRPE